LSNRIIIVFVLFFGEGVVVEGALGWQWIVVVRWVEGSKNKGGGGG